jgi:hypothetical protein
MPTSDAAGMPDGRDLIRTMGWESMPYSCVAVARKATVDSTRSVWSWLVLIPWSDDSKPWIDGTEIFTNSLLTEADEREQILSKIRSILDDRYGESVGNQATDDLIERLLGDD